MINFLLSLDKNFLNNKRNRENSIGISSNKSNNNNNNNIIKITNENYKNNITNNIHYNNSNNNNNNNEINPENKGLHYRPKREYALKNKKFSNKLFRIEKIRKNKLEPKIRMGSKKYILKRIQYCWKSYIVKKWSSCYCQGEKSGHHYITITISVVESGGN